MRKFITYTSVNHSAAKTINVKYGSDGEVIIVELFIGLLMVGLSAYGYFNNIFMLFVLCSTVSFLCLFGILISISFMR